MSVAMLPTTPVRSDQPCVNAATIEDETYVIEAFTSSLCDYYSGDHEAHARRVLSTHLSPGGADRRGLLSVRQKLFILRRGRKPCGLINLAFKRQDTCKISPLIIHPPEERKQGFGALLLRTAEAEARAAGVRQIYCTVAENNQDALRFFVASGFVICGRAAGQYKCGETEVILTRKLAPALPDGTSRVTTDPTTIISVAEARSDDDWVNARRLLLDNMSPAVDGADQQWLESLRWCGGPDRTKAGFDHFATSYVFFARDRTGAYRAAAVATAKKGESLKIMPLAATDLDGFRAIVTDLPALLMGKGRRKAFMHLSPDSRQVAALQAANWELEALLPDAYSNDSVTQQWGYPLGGDMPMPLRIKPEFQRQIASGRKTLEIRVGYDQIKHIEAGTTLVLESNEGRVPCDVVAVRNYRSFKEMLAVEDVEKALPGVAPAQALRQLRRIYPRTKERLGVIVLELKPVVADL